MKKALLAIAIGIIITLFVSTYSNAVQADLAHNLVRFHVVANSNSAEDQELKHRVRDRIIKEMQEQFEVSDDIESTKKIIRDNMQRIEEIARDEIRKSNKDYPVSVSLGNYPFPTKVYGEITLPAGKYEALRIVIGEGEGENWWCVLFPPLCFVDATHGEMPEESKQRLKNVLSEEEYKIITSANKEDEIPVQIKFKVVEWWQNSKIKIQTALNGTK
ncbi:MAG: stage II sporulation protein R [Clostridiaceae bacterium]|nr:stage II sporulation protein R [Clostridiaceae bacterium]